MNSLDLACDADPCGFRVTRFEYLVPDRDILEVHGIDAEEYADHRGVFFLCTCERETI